MAANYDWKCAAHGVFSGPKPGKCPHGCGAGMVEMIWLQMPGTIGDKTKTTDNMRQQLADHFGMTDVQARAGRPAMPETYRWNQQEVVGTSDTRGVGKPYSVEVDKDAALAQQVAAQGGAEDGSRTFASMKQNGVVQFRANVIQRDDTPVTKSDIDRAE